MKAPLKGKQKSVLDCKRENTGVSVCWLVGLLVLVIVLGYFGYTVSQPTKAISQTQTIQSPAAKKANTSTTIPEIPGVTMNV